MSFKRKIQRNMEKNQQNQKLSIFIKAEPIGLSGDMIYRMAEDRDEATHEIMVTTEERNVIVKTENLNFDIQKFLKSKCSNLETKIAN